MALQAACLLFERVMGSIILTAIMGEVGDGGAYRQTVLPCLAKDLAFLLHIDIVISGVVTRSVVQTGHWQNGANQASSFSFED